MKIITPLSSKKVPFDLDGYIMHSNSKTEIVHLTLKKNEEIDIHSNPFDVFFYTLEGEATLVVDGKEYLLPKDFGIEIAKDIPRGIKNNREDKLRVLVFKIF